MKRPGNQGRSLSGKAFRIRKKMIEKREIILTLMAILPEIYFQKEHGVTLGIGKTRLKIRMKPIEAGAWNEALKDELDAPP